MVEPYEFMASGYCLMSLVPDGSLLTVDPTQEISAGELVAVVFDGKESPFTGFQGGLEFNGLLGVVKLFLGSTTTRGGEPVHLLGQFDPPTVVSAPAKYLTAMHRVTGGREAPWLEKADDEDNEGEIMAALDLLSPFIRGGTAQPIGINWRPPEPGGMTP